MITKASRYSYSDTLERLTTAIAKAENTIFATIDQADAAQRVGLKLRPTTLIIFGNPKGGTPLMQAYPLIALDLPLKFLVWEDQEGAHVAYTSATEIGTRYSVVGPDPALLRMDEALDMLSNAVASPEHL